MLVSSLLVGESAVDGTQMLAEQLRARWVREKVPIQDGASAAELDAFEARHGIRIPEEVRVYLHIVNGMIEWGWDEELIEFLSLDRMGEELNENSDGPFRWLIVAHYLIFSRVYAVRATAQASDTCAVYALGEGADRPLFSSFTRMLEEYVSDPAAMVTASVPPL